jgi:hypothetical protein
MEVFYLCALYESGKVRGLLAASIPDWHEQNAAREKRATAI